MQRISMKQPRKVLLLELNEVSWRVVDQLISERGPSFLPNFGKLRAEGAWGIQSAVERPPLLDPWVTWVTLHTGVGPEVHGASVLEQSEHTITAKRTWQYASEAGRSVGVFGSISAYPPPPLAGFVVPGPFAPGNETHPPQLEPVQALNRRYTQAHNGTSRPPGAFEAIRNGIELFQLGLRARTVGKVALQLLRERIQPHLRWKRVCLQPELNFDFFTALYRRHRPDFATWHTNHAAHFMHHYWRAWDDSSFPAKSSPLERSRFGEAVPFGYRLCDELIGRAMRLIDRDTVLAVASSMGQQPFVSDRYAEGKIVVRIKDIDKLLDIVGRQGVESVVPTMVPQWNLAVPNPDRRAFVKRQFEAIRRQQGDGPIEPAFAVQETHDQLTITPLGLARYVAPTRYDFALPDGRVRSAALEELFAMDTPTVKQGMHHIDGMLAFFGDGVPARRLPDCTNLDVAPTLLSLLAVPVPAAMRGQALQVVASVRGPDRAPRSALHGSEIDSAAVH
jgi:Type I phosphodiesterase / nucleotide pyrophosphatase